MTMRTTTTPGILAGLTLAWTITLPAQNTAPAPVVWGALSGNTSCIIFAEGHKTTGHFYGIAATTRTVGKLTVVEKQNSTFADKDLLETQENMDSLMQLARTEHAKFVKIPEKYTPELLEAARTACKADASSTDH